MEYQDRAEHRKALELLTVKVILSYWLYHMMQVQICWQSATVSSFACQRKQLCSNPFTGIW